MSKNSQASAAVADPVRAVLLEIPVLDSKAYAKRVLLELSGPDARMLRNVAEGLDADGQRLANGRPIRNADDAIAWICQQLASKTGRPTK
jgi:hypothetical protein